MIPALDRGDAGLDTFAKITGDDCAWGWNVGAMYNFNGDPNIDVGAARIGLAYRSKIKYDVQGSVNFTNPTPPTLTGALAPFNPVVVGVSNAINQTRLFNSGVQLDVTMPDTASLSYYQKLNDTVGPPGRRHVDRLEQHPGAADRAHQRQRASVLPENFKDTWRFSAGFNYQYNEKTVLRAGVAYDQSPVNDIDRSARLPDNDRTWLTIGGRFKYSTRAQLRRRRGLHLRQGRLDQQCGQSGQHRRQRPHQR